MGNTNSYTNESNSINIKDTIHLNESIDNYDSFHTIASYMKKLNNKDKKDVIVQIMMPLYYISSPLTSEDTNLAIKSWNTILNNESTKYNNELILGNLNNINSCKEWFEISFYQRLFDVHPLSKNMFSNPNTQGRFLTSLISFIFTALDNEEKVKSRLIELALNHCKRGVKVCEYAILGDVMFWSLKEVLGSLYDEKTHLAWVKIFSMMLNVIIPVAIEQELQDNKPQTNRMLLKKINKGHNTNNNNISNLFSNKKKNQVAVDNCPFGFKSSKTIEESVV